MLKIRGLLPGCSHLVKNKDDSVIYDAYLSQDKTITIRTKEFSQREPSLYNLSSLYKYLPPDFKEMEEGISINYTEEKEPYLGVFRDLHVITPTYLSNGVITSYNEKTYRLATRLQRGKEITFPAWVLKYFGPGEEELQIFNAVIAPENYHPKENPEGYKKVPKEFIPDI